MIAQVVWKNLFFKRKCIPQGSLVFIAKINRGTATIIYEDSVYKVSYNSFNVITSENDILPAKEIQKKFHNRRAHG